MFGNWRSSENDANSSSSSSSNNLKKDNHNVMFKKTIDEDRKLFPHCGYSTQQSTSCSSSAESGYVCETIHRIQRLCPNEKPVTILQSHDTSKNPKFYLDSNNDDLDNNNNITSFFPNLFTGKKSLFGGLFTSPPPDLFQRLEDVEKDLHGIVAGHQSSRNNKFPTVSPSLGSRNTDKDSDTEVDANKSIWSHRETDSQAFSWSRRSNSSPNNNNSTAGPDTLYDPKSIERV